MIKRFKKMGYRDGFYYAGIPCVCRRSLKNNDFIIFFKMNVFKSIVL